MAPIGYRGRVATRFSGAHSTRSVDSKIYVPAEIRSRHSFSRAALKLSDIPEARPTRPARKRQRIRGGNEPPQKKRRWMLRILGSTAINHRPTLLFSSLFPSKSPRSFSLFKKRIPFFSSNVFCEANSSLRFGDNEGPSLGASVEREVSRLLREILKGNGKSERRHA